MSTIEAEKYRFQLLYQGIPIEELSNEELIEALHQAAEILYKTRDWHKEEVELLEKKFRRRRICD